LRPRHRRESGAQGQAPQAAPSAAGSHPSTACGATSRPT
jgi:hypothetical protein